MEKSEVENCTMENAWELAEFAQDNGIYVKQGYEVPDIWDLKDEDDLDYIYDIIKEIMLTSDLTVIYDYIKQAVEGNSRYAWEVKGCLVPFTEEDFEQLKEAILEWMD